MMCSPGIFLCFFFLFIQAQAASRTTDGTNPPPPKSEILNLPTALQITEDHSPLIQKQKSVREEVSWKRVEAYSGFLPTLTAQGTYLTDYQYVLTDIKFGLAPVTVPQVIPTTNYYLTAQWSIFDGFASTNRLRAAQSFERAAENELQWTQFQVQRQIQLQFFKALAAKILKDTAEQNLKTFQDHLTAVNSFKKAGLSTNYDVLRVEVQVSESQSEVLNANDNYELSKSKLAEMMGADVSIQDLEGDLPVLQTSLIENVNFENLPERYDLLALKNSVAGFDAQESSMSRYWIPRVSLFGQYQRYNNKNDRFNDDGAFRDAHQVGINFTWNLFDGMVSIAKSKQSIEQRFQAEKNLAIAQLKAKQDLAFWKRKFIYYCQVYTARTGDTQKATEFVRLAQEGRKAGTRTNTDLLDAENELYRAQAGVVNAQIGALEALTNLELTSGQEFYHVKR